MRRALIALAAAALLAAGCGEKSEPSIVDTPAQTPTPTPTPQTGAAVTGERRVDQRVVDLTVRSPALGRTADVRLLTPEGWSKTASRRWPVLYLLHGCCDTYDSWVRETRIEELAALRDVLVVMPEGGDVGFYSDWRKGPRWETFHVTELPPLLERGYRAGPRRAVAGLSMGGLGALGYAARHPGTFAAAASFSGVLHPLAHARSYLALFGQYAPDALDVWGDPERDRAVWERHDPTELAGRLRGTPVFVSAGDGRPGPLDRPGRSRDRIEAAVGSETRDFVARARKLGVEVRAELYGPGTHDWPYWERELRRALPLLLQG